MLVFPHFVLHTITGDSCTGDYTEHKDRAGGISDYFCFLQCIPGASSELWKCNADLVYYFCVYPAYYPWEKRRWYDLLQIPLSIVFTRFLNLFDAAIHWESESFAANLLLLLAAIILTGAGAAMSVNMRLVPNPGDGIVAAIADCIHRDMGFAKNMFDLMNICMTFIIGIVSGHFLLGIGIGTVFAVIGVGRAVAAFNYLCKEKMDVLAGISEETVSEAEICTE